MNNGNNFTKSYEDVGGMVKLSVFRGERGRNAQINNGIYSKEWGKDSNGRIITRYNVTVDNGNGALLSMAIYGDDLFWRINGAVNNGGMFVIKKIKN